MPTYHLAHLVDDHLMKISHVIRERSASVATPSRPALQGFGWESPLFAHLPFFSSPTVRAN
jgi:glutamyl-tRNA synthetase